MTFLWEQFGVGKVHVIMLKELSNFEQVFFSNLCCRPFDTMTSFLYFNKYSFKYFICFDKSGVSYDVEVSFCTEKSIQSCSHTLQCLDRITVFFTWLNCCVEV